ncbi:MAG: hypothetical protein K2Y39_25640, partial [Candidatus Obscuribacterales bacterium]|nr:hypothetical protein [Candidatus Obscuribacterales bacterium]
TVPDGVPMLPFVRNPFVKVSSPKRRIASSLAIGVSALLLVLWQANSAALAQNPNDIANIPVSPVPSGQMGMPQVNMTNRGGSNIQEWFHRYDNVRRQAQMSPAEKARADGLMSKGMGGLGAMLAGDEKMATQNLLTKMVGKYQTAAEQMKSLPLFRETEQLHRGYYQYFSDARQLFSDYLRVQSNLFAMDETTGKPVAGLLMGRKQNLEQLDMNNKALDEQLRQQFNIPPYRY